MPYMYILKCADGSFYTGSTWNLEKRLAEHESGIGAKHTARRLPVELVYCEECDRVEDAFHREKQIQGWSRRKKQALIDGDSNELHRLAECRNGTNCGFDSAQPPYDSAQPPYDSAQPPYDSAQPPYDSAQPPYDSAQPPGNCPDPERSRRAAQPPGNLNRSLSGAEGNIASDRKELEGLLG